MIQAFEHFEDGLRIITGLMGRFPTQDVRSQASRSSEQSNQHDLHHSVQSGKLTYFVAEAAKILGLSRNSVYEAVRTRQIPSINLGRRIFIPRVGLEKMFSSGSNNDVVEY